MRSAVATSEPIVTAAKPLRRRRLGRIEAQETHAATDHSTAPTEIPSAALATGGDQLPTDTQCRLVSAGMGIPTPVDAALLARIVDRYRVRRTLLVPEGGMTLRIKAAERRTATFRLRALGKEPAPGKMPTPTEADKAVVAAIYPAFFLARDVLEEQRRKEEKALVADTLQLPIMAWAASVRGLGPLSVAALVGEIGDPGAYSTPSKVWKRLGLGVIDGRTQRRVAGDPAEAIRQGYSPARRAAVFVIGENLIRSSNVHARSIYDAVKAKEIAKDGVTRMHAHKRALRLMQKRLVLAFWLAWRQISRGEPLSDVPRSFMSPPRST